MLKLIKLRWYVVPSGQINSNSCERVTLMPGDILDSLNNCTNATILDDSSNTTHKSTQLSKLSYLEMLVIYWLANAANAIIDRLLITKCLECFFSSP